MPKPPFVVEVKARNIDETRESILAPLPTSKQDTEARSPQPTCTNCGCTQGIQTAGTPPHYAAVRCANCFIKWLRKSKSAGGVS